MSSRIYMYAALLLGIFLGTGAAVQASNTLPAPQNIRIHSRQWRVDILWDEPLMWSSRPDWKFEVERAPTADGPFEKCHEGNLEYCGHSDFLGTAGQTFHYRVRMVEAAPTPTAWSEWSMPQTGTSQPLNEETLPVEMQEAGFRYFYDAAHPVSGFPRMQTIGWSRDMAASSGIGMGFFNIVVGVERGFISRELAAERVLKITEFLLTNTERFHGAYSHVIDASNGKAVAFMPKDDGADLLETAYLIQGLLLAREYFSGTDYVETRIRELADEIWKGVEWDWFVRPSRYGGPVLSWHWSPNYEWDVGLHCHGFCEVQILYLLALSSPTYPVDDELYWKGWRHPEFGGKETHFGVELPLQRLFDMSLFPAHYTYMGIDPNAISYQGTTYNEIFQRWCTAQIRYTRSRKDDFIGYGTPLWGLTASANRVGYKAHAPGHNDDGTIAPTAALSSIPYMPEEAKACMMEMFTMHGQKLWGPYGFFDAFNLTQDWVADQQYLCIDVGPVGPMIENHLSGKCWSIFMNTPEIDETLKRLQQTEPKATMLFKDTFSDGDLETSNDALGYGFNVFDPGGEFTESGGVGHVAYTPDEWATGSIDSKSTVDATAAGEVVGIRMTWGIEDLAVCNLFGDAGGITLGLTQSIGNTMGETAPAGLYIWLNDQWDDNDTFVVMESDGSTEVWNPITRQGAGGPVDLFTGSGSVSLTALVDGNYELVVSGFGAYDNTYSGTLNHDYTTLFNDSMIVSARVRQGPNDIGLDYVTVETVIPEPATLGLISASALGVLFVRRRFLI